MVEVNVADPASAEAMVAETVRRMGRLDILVNNAGINIRKRSLADIPPETWDEVMKIRDQIISGEIKVEPVFDAAAVRALMTDVTAGE